MKPLLGTYLHNFVKTKIDKKLSWRETFSEMADANEDWSDLEVVLTDGIIQIDSDATDAEILLQKKSAHFKNGRS